MGKILHVRKGEALSLQYHERKDEWLLVTRGTVDVELGIVDAAPVLLGYVRSAGEPPAVEHYIPVALGAITLAGLASSPIFSLQLWQFSALSVLFGVGFVVAGRLDYLRIHGSEKRGHVVLQEAILIAFLAGAYIVVVTLPFNPILKLLWILTITFLASYRSFRING